jgi:uncharacterized protein YdaU (DUF1376 family)
MSFGWHPREHRKALDGMLMLTLEERGAYNTCLDLIYDREGPIPDDPRWLSGWMGVSARKWSMIRASLIVKGKLFEIIVNGLPSLMNQRAAIELENQAKLSRKLRENGAKGGRKVAEKAPNPKENNGEAQALGSAPLKLIDKDIDSRGSDVPPDGETSGAEAPVIDPNAKAWRDGVDLLVAMSGMSAKSARTFIGGLLATYGIEARDLLSAIGEGFNSQTQDPKGLLTAAAKARGKRRQTGPPRRVGWV